MCVCAYTYTHTHIYIFTNLLDLKGLTLSQVIYDIINIFLQKSETADSYSRSSGFKTHPADWLN